jgi:hypothetical protein
MPHPASSPGRKHRLEWSSPGPAGRCGGKRPDRPCGVLRRQRRSAMIGGQGTAGLGSKGVSQ